MAHFKNPLKPARLYDFHQEAYFTKKDFVIFK